MCEGFFFSFERFCFQVQRYRCTCVAALCVAVRRRGSRSLC